MKVIELYGENIVLLVREPSGIEFIVALKEEEYEKYISKDKKYLKNGDESYLIVKRLK